MPRESKRNVSVILFDLRMDRSKALRILNEIILHMNILRGNDKTTLILLHSADTKNNRKFPHVEVAVEEVKYTSDLKRFIEEEMQSDDSEDSNSSRAITFSSLSVRSPQAKRSRIVYEAPSDQTVSPSNTGLRKVRSPQARKIVYEVPSDRTVSPLNTELFVCGASSNQTVNALVRELEKLEFNSKTSVNLVEDFRPCFKEVTPRQLEVPNKKLRLSKRACISPIVHRYKSNWTDNVSHKGTNTESNLNVPVLEEASTALEPNIIIVNDSSSSSSSLPDFKKSLSNVTSITSPSFRTSTLDLTNFYVCRVGTGRNGSSSDFNASFRDFEQPLKKIEKPKYKKIKRVVSSLASGIFKSKEPAFEVKPEDGDAIKSNNFENLLEEVQDSGGGDDINYPGKIQSDVFLERRPQNTQLKFYDVNKTPTDGKSTKTEGSSPPSVISEEPPTKKCCDISCCLNFMFPKRAQHYF